MNTTKVTGAGKLVLLATAGANAKGQTYVHPNTPAVRKLERDGLITRGSDGWWWLTADGIAYVAECQHGSATGLHAEADDARDVSDALMSRIRNLIAPAAMMHSDAYPIAENAMDAPMPFRTSRKVKSTSKSRKYRKGA